MIVLWWDLKFQVYFIDVLHCSSSQEFLVFLFSYACSELFRSDVISRYPEILLLINPPRQDHFSIKFMSTCKQDQINLAEKDIFLQGARTYVNFLLIGHFFFFLKSFVFNETFALGARCTFYAIFLSSGFTCEDHNFYSNLLVEIPITRFFFSLKHTINN